VNVIASLFRPWPGVAVCVGLSTLASPIAAQCPPSESAKLVGFGAPAVDGDRLLAHQGGNAVHVLEHGPGGWVHTAQLMASDGFAGDLFGGSFDLWHDRAIVGAPGDDDHGPGSGSAYVFHFDGASWHEVAKLTAPDGQVTDRFGSAVAIQGDRAVVGAPDDDDPFTDMGSAYVFEFDGATWAQTAKIQAADGEPSDHLASALDLSRDLILLGAYYDDDGGPGSGSAYVFRKVGTQWLQDGKLLASDGAAYDAFGTSVALRSDRALVGAYGNDAVALDAGSAYVFERTDSGWIETQQLVAADGRGEEWFGLNVALSPDGALVGARNDGDLGWRAGSAYLFRPSGWSWVQVAELHASDAAAGDGFGRVVAAGGGRLFAGSPGDGSIYVFEDGAPPGLAFCSGDGSLPTACPCAPPDTVPNPPSAAGHGCANPLNPSGALLFACGGTAPDSLRFSADVGPGYQGFGYLIASGSQAPNGIAAFDGVRCLAGSLLRFGGHAAGTNGDATGSWSYPNDVQTVPVSIATGQPSGQVAYYQLFYRSAAAGFCNPSTANWSNGYAVAWP
jgi:hypothetical protein